ncbi:MAG: hypothetical protein JOZ18_11480 [Chloroflexi bacterium]|nr:hypothetical protein [Chloroflexota bacterium]
MSIVLLPGTFILRRSQWMQSIYGILARGGLSIRLELPGLHHPRLAVSHTGVYFVPRDDY